MENKREIASSGQSVSHTSKQEACLSCGKTGHKRTNCKYKNFVYRSCNKTGRLAPVCLSRGTKQITVVSLFESESESDIESELESNVFSVSLYKVGKNGIHVLVELEGVSVNMELDVGAGV